MLRFSAICCALAVSLGGSPIYAEAPRLQLASEGKARLPVVVPREATPPIRQAAETLAAYLQKISGAEFDVVAGDGAVGIAVGRPEDFPQLPFDDRWDAADPTQRENYLLRTHPEGIYVLGATEAAVEHAVWDLLYRLGHRQFFPGETWEVIPRKPVLTVAVDAQEEPDFLARRIWYGFGPWDYAAEPYAQWCARNRAVSGVTLSTGHAYDGIISRNKATFEAHPEYLGLVAGERKSTKLCISNPGLRKLVIEDALKQLAKDPSRDSVSVDPSDGLGWCECRECEAMGSISDRALTLANEVAAAVNEEHPGTYVGMYAYSAHSPPPNIQVHPQVVVSVATAFIRGGFDVDELLAGWRRQGATLGIREYLSVNTWDRDLPGRSRGSDLAYLRRTIPHFQSEGARFYSAESSDNWGPNGLGYYLAARMLWDVEEADHVEKLVEDFLDKSFGEAKAPMSEFYRLLNGASEPLLSDDLIGRMYRLLAEARRLTDDPAIHRRLDDLTLYTRYVELYFDYMHSDGHERQANFERMIRHVYRMRETMMVHAKAIYRDVAARDRNVSIPENAAWSVPEDRNPWKSGEPFTRAELERFTQAGIANRKLREFEAVEFSDELVPASRLDLPGRPPGDPGAYSRGERIYYTWVADPSQPIRLTVTAGRIYQDRGPATITLRAGDRPDEEPAATASVPPDGKERELTLKAPQPGLYAVTVSDGAAGTAVEWPPGQPMTIVSSPQQQAEFHGRWSLYFYVPKGTKVVGGFASGPGALQDAEGRTVHTFDNRPGYFAVAVEPDQQGTLWKFDRCAGRRLLMTVPPCLARSHEELLLPAEVVRRAAAPRGEIP
jgi:hypothetical protein